MAGIIGFATGNIIPGSARPDTTKAVEPVSADGPFSVSKVLGRSIPIVIGTGKVDGAPVIGGAATTQVITGYNSVPNPTGGSGIIGFQTGNFIPDIGAAGPVQVPIYATQQSAQLGYLLAYDPFGDGYELIRLEINDEVVFDAENGIGASETFRFYGGTQTTVDPITADVIGTKAGAWQGFAMVYLSGYVASSAPTVKAVISNAADDDGGTQPIAWTGAAPTTGAPLYSYEHAGYDPSENAIYQVLTAADLPGLGQCYLSVLDADTHLERYRIPLAGSDAYAASTTPTLLCLRASGYVWVKLSIPSDLGSPTRVYNIATGAIVAEFSEDSGEDFVWYVAEQFVDKWLIAGNDADGSGGNPSAFAVIDLVAGSVDVTRNATAFSGPFVRGRIGPGSASFFSNTAASGGDVYEVTFNGDAWSFAVVYSPAGNVSGIHYDPLTEYLLVMEKNGSTFNARRIAPDTGLVDTFTVSVLLESMSGPLNTDRTVPKSGTAIFIHGTHEIWGVDIAAKTAAKISDFTVPAFTFEVPFVDQTKASYFLYVNHVWVEYRLPGTSPRLVDLSDIITKVMFLAGYAPEELTFEGFSGLSGYGFVIASDTNVRTALQSIADIYGFSFADIGSGFYFKKPGRDDAFALDAILTTADLVFAENSAIDSTDEASIRTTSRVELDYISREQGYNSRPASFQMPPINNSRKVDKYSTPMVLSDLDAKTFCTQKYFEAQAQRRDHTYSVIGQPTLLPGDVVSVPSGAITYAVQIASVGLNRDMSADIQASDFQTSVATTITPVTSVGLGPVAVSLQSQYIHLDVPLFHYADDLGGLGLRQYGVVASRGQAGWGGGVLYRGDTAADLTALLSQAPQYGVVGICETVLANPLDPFATTDDSTVTIRKTAGSMALLVDKTEDQVLAGANFAFIGAQGRWEGVGYKTAVDNGNGTFTLSGFTIRGYRGTEVFASLHQVGDRFVMIDASWIKGVSHSLADLYATKYYKAIGLTQNPATGTVVPHTIIGAAETPYACVNLSAAIGSPDGLDISWDYRSRLAAGLNPVTFGEAALAFEVDIYDGPTYKRTLTSSTGSVHYASADVASDLGSDPPAEITFDVFMMTAIDILVAGQARQVAGRGYRARAHIILDGGFVPSFDSDVWSFDSTFVSFDQE
ncbi:putative tail protein [Mesorhizobium loti]|uniref:Putative tail protein n=1 Tax=Rhizobium loti TaxID=381 RepID=A0A8E2WAI3_RHILI|nr:phage tail protein [Mesorhizobium loti]PWJ88348.1 putative tail protein [Mesorhizobium loti]